MRDLPENHQLFVNFTQFAGNHYEVVLLFSIDLPVSYSIKKNKNILHWSLLNEQSLGKSLLSLGDA